MFHGMGVFNGFVLGKKGGKYELSWFWILKFAELPHNSGEWSAEWAYQPHYTNSSTTDSEWALIELMWYPNVIFVFYKSGSELSDPMGIRSISKFISRLISYIFGEKTIIYPYTYPICSQFRNDLDCNSAQFRIGFSVQRDWIYL